MGENRECRIGRYEAVTTPDGVEIYDMQDRQQDGRGNAKPLTVIRLDDAETAREGCLRAIEWLRESGRIDASDYYRHAEAFMGSDSVRRQ